MIRKLRVKNFRSIADVEIDFDKLTVLVGRNGAGKSTIVDVLQFVSDALLNGLDWAIIERKGIGGIRRVDAGGEEKIEIDLTVDGHRDVRGEYGFTIAPGNEGEYALVHEHGSAEIDGKQISFEVRDGKWIDRPETRITISPDLNTTPPKNDLAIRRSPLVSYEFGALVSPMLDFAAYSISPTDLRQHQPQHTKQSLLGRAENLAAVLRGMLQRDDPGGGVIREALAMLTGDVVDIRVQPAGGALVTELLHRQSNNQEAWFDLGQESDGTIRMLALLVAVYQQIPPSTMAIEEPELNLHPGALSMLADVLKVGSERFQLIVTTQSPDLISEFDAGMLRVVERVDGLTKAGPVDPSQIDIVNRELFTTGDLLRIEGLQRREEGNA